jgi:hypothetical protein
MGASLVMFCVSGAAGVSFHHDGPLGFRAVRPGAGSTGVRVGRGPDPGHERRRFDGVSDGLGGSSGGSFQQRPGGLGSPARSTQKRQRFCERFCLTFTCERPGKSFEDLRESFKKLSRGRLTGTRTGLRSGSSAARFGRTGCLEGFGA